jgi:tRNA dimethylallyltransferase
MPYFARTVDNDFKPLTLCILGPTAGGKSALAMALAKALAHRAARSGGAASAGAEIISADSMQIYRGMDVGTAKPPAEERALVRHHLIDIADPHLGGFTLADWLTGAQAAVRDIHARGKHAIVVGGTNLYMKALIEGMFAGPPVDDALRAALELQPTEMLRRELEQADPVAAARIHPNDRRRTIRAVEVHRQTGEPISALQSQWRAQPQELPEGWHLIGLDWSVEGINKRINTRVAAMFDEVTALAAAGPLSRQAVEAVGYYEVLLHLAGQCTLEEAAEAMKVRTRRYAKQQRTWLRRFRIVPGSTWIEADTVTPNAAIDHVLKNIFRNQP